MITKEDCVSIGKIGKIHGLGGQVVMLSDNDLPEQYSDEPVFVLLDGAPVPFFIAPGGLNRRNDYSYIVKFDDVDTPSQAARLVGNEVLVEKSSFRENPQMETDIGLSDLSGFLVKDLISGEQGKVTDVVDYSGNVVFTIAIFGKEILLPFSENYIKEIIIEDKKILVAIPRDIIDLY